MKHTTFSDLVKKHFPFLIDNYGFSVIYEEPYRGTGNCLVVLQGNDCRVRVVLDRGQVFVDASPRVAPDDWYDLSIITAFLTQGPEEDEWEYAFPSESLDWEARTEAQLARLADTLQPYWNQVFQLFRENVFKQRQKELADFIKRRSNQTW